MPCFICCPANHRDLPSPPGAAQGPGGEFVLAVLDDEGLKLYQYTGWRFALVTRVPLPAAGGGADADGRLSAFTRAGFSHLSEFAVRRPRSQPAFSLYGERDASRRRGVGVPDRRSGGGGERRRCPRTAGYLHRVILTSMPVSTVGGRRRPWRGRSRRPTPRSVRPQRAVAANVADGWPVEVCEVSERCRSATQTSGIVGSLFTFLGLWVSLDKMRYI